MAQHILLRTRIAEAHVAERDDMSLAARVHQTAVTRLHRRRIIQKQYKLISIIAALFNFHHIEYNILQTVIELRRRHHTHGKITHRDHPADGKHADIKITDTVPQYVYKIDSPGVTYLLNPAFLPDVRHLVRLPPCPVAHHAAAVIQADILSILKRCQLEKHITKYAVALGQSDKAPGFNLIVARREP